MKVTTNLAAVLSLVFLATALPQGTPAPVVVAPPATPATPATPGAPVATAPAKQVPCSNDTIPESVIPDYGIEAGVQSPDQVGSCIGANGKYIPCTCPPSKSDFAAMLGTFAARGKAGESALNFSTNYADQEVATNLARVTAMIVTLQNFNFDAEGKPGMGCPIVSAPNLAALQKKLLAGQNVEIKPLP